MVPIVIYLTCPPDVLHIDGRNVWTLRGWSRPVAWMSIALFALCLGLMACPNSLPVTPGAFMSVGAIGHAHADLLLTAESWSWSPAITVAAAVLSSLTWVVYGNARYAGPIKSLTLWTTGREVGLPRAKSKSRKTKTTSMNATSVIKDKTTTMGKGATAAIFEGSLPTQAQGDDTYWTETGVESGWTEGSDLSQTRHEEDERSTVAQETETQATARRSFPRTDSN